MVLFSAIHAAMSINGLWAASKTTRKDSSGYIQIRPLNCHPSVSIPFLITQTGVVTSIDYLKVFNVAARSDSTSVVDFVVFWDWPLDVLPYSTMEHNHSTVKREP